MKSLNVRYSIHNDKEVIPITVENMDKLHDSLQRFEQQLFLTAAAYVLSADLNIPLTSTPKIKINSCSNTNKPTPSL